MARAAGSQLAVGEGALRRGCELGLNELQPFQRVAELDRRSVVANALASVQQFRYGTGDMLRGSTEALVLFAIRVSFGPIR